MPRKAAAKKVAKKSSKTPTQKRPVKTAANRTIKKPKQADVFDLTAFPPESLQTRTIAVCLACALDVLTRHMDLSPQRAQADIKNYTPTVEELTTPTPSRPNFAWPAEACPYCAASPKWHAPLIVVRIEGGKSTDAPRRALLKNVKTNKNFTVIEERSTERDALYHWLAKTGAELNPESDRWLLEATRHWLGRRHPEEDWAETFQRIRFVRRSRRLEETDVEIQGPGLFLAPSLFDEVLFIQYLLSRSHKAGGQTFEGRLTLNDLIRRLRGGGYLRRMGVTTSNSSDALEQLVEILGGEGRVKFFYVVDRRGFLERLASIKTARVPRLRS